MSRRKQSNPKPLKRQSEDSLDSIAALLRLPVDAFSVRDPQDDVNEYTLYTRRRFKCGTTFGPYEGRLVPEDETDGLNVVETQDERGETVHFALTDEAGAWLKLLRPVQPGAGPGNAALFHNGVAAWCTITTDLESETELLVRHQWAGGALPPAADDPRAPDPLQRTDRPPTDDDRNDSDTDPCSQRSPNAYCDIYNGRLSADPLVKREPSSPCTTPPSCTDDAPAFLNGSNYAPAFPCGGTVSTTEGPLRCEHCDAFFNSRRVLDLHQTYYCQGRTTSGHLVNSDTDTEDAAKIDSTTAAHSPGASENEDVSSPPKDLPSYTLEDAPSSPRRPRVDPPRRLFQCQYCSYSTDKKASLTRHVRMHGAPARPADGPAMPTPPMARYCANCDIQFASYKNYQVHKEFYCNTRHVHKSASSSSPQQQQQQPPLSPSGSNQQPSPTEKPGYNVVLKQPLYAAISTSPLILVPCSYVAGGGGLSPGLIPAGNIVIPNPQASSPDPQKNVIPTFTVMPGESTKKEEKAPARDETPSKVPKPEVAKSPTGDHKTEAEQPLDLSFRKKSIEAANKATAQRPSESGPSHPSPPSPCEETSSAPPSLPAMPLLSADLGGRDAPVLAPPVLVKQGASKCVDCNIVFYKHENYLVHKNKYCAARSRSAHSDSPDKQTREEAATPEREEQGKASQKSPMSSPRMSNSRTPPAADAEPVETAPLLQYYCMACGIKYSSLDNLRAHQLYYCPKREMQPVAIVPSYPGMTHSRTAGQDFKCSKCKNAYPTEELLRQHPCVVQRKCPYCDVYCPTLSAAQRHLVTHTGIKSFRCSLCGYKGHTLRGMRTHIRIHLDKNNSTPEEAYILCMDEGGAEIGCAGKKTPGVRVSSDRIKSVISTEPPHGEMGVAVSPISVPPPSVVPPDVLAIKAIPDDPVATGDTTHWCQICGYSSSYKGNVVRHVKLVHKDLVSTQAMSNIVNSRPSAETALKPGEPIEHSGRASSQEAILAPSMADHSNSSSSLDVKPMLNGLVGKSDQVLRLEDKPLVLKTEAASPPPPSSSKGLKRPLTEDGQCGAFSSKSGPKYCKSCDISFNYLSNFLAHKKFYCTPRQGDVSSAQDSTSVQPVQ